jgi:hypothetical protein
MILEAAFCQALLLDVPLHLQHVIRKGHVVSLDWVMEQTTLATAASWKVHILAQSLT